MSAERVQDRVLSAIVEEPGVRGAELVRRNLAPVSSVYAAISKLREEGKITPHDGGGWRVTGQPDAGDSPAEGPPPRRCEQCGAELHYGWRPSFCPRCEIRITLLIEDGREVISRMETRARLYRRQADVLIGLANGILMYDAIADAMEERGERLDRDREWFEAMKAAGALDALRRRGISVDVIERFEHSADEALRESEERLAR